MNETRLLTVTMVAKKLHVSNRTVYRWVRAGDIPSVRLSPNKAASIRIRSQDLERFLAERIDRRDQK